MTSISLYDARSIKNIKSPITNVQFIFPLNSPGVTPTTVEEENASSLNFTVLNSEAAKRISSTSSSMSDHDQEKDTYEEQTKLIRNQANNKPIESTYDFRYLSTR